MIDLFLPLLKSKRLAIVLTPLASQGQVFAKDTSLAAETECCKQHQQTNKPTCLSREKQTQEAGVDRSASI